MMGGIVKVVPRDGGVVEGGIWDVVVVAVVGGMVKVVPRDGGGGGYGGGNLGGGDRGTQGVNRGSGSWGDRGSRGELEWGDRGTQGVPSGTAVALNVYNVTETFHTNKMCLG